MKKIILLILTLITILSALSGCRIGSKEETQAPTEAPTAAPTNAPTVAPTNAPATQAPTVKPTMAPSNLDVAWFDDAVFLGDSVTVALDHSAMANPKLLGNAKFICAQSLSYHNALWDLDDENAVHPTYEGEKILSETAAEVTHANKIFILLGVNDIVGYSADETLDAAKQLCERILTHSPDVKIYFQSVTPVLKAKEDSRLNNTKVCDFNTVLQAYCNENGYTFIDLYHQLCDNSGGLNPAYCGDPTDQGIHFNGVGCDTWANYLKSTVSDADILSVNPDNDEPDEINFEDSTTPSPTVAESGVSG